MLEHLYFPAVIIFISGIFITLYGVWRFIFNSEKADQLTKRLLTISFSIASLISISLIIYWTTKGNFLAFLLFPVFILLIALLIYAIGSLTLSAYLLCTDPSSLIRMRNRARPAIVAIIGLLLFACSRAYILEVASLKDRYGSLGKADSCNVPLDQKEIEVAYSTWLLRNNNWLLRCLLFRNDVPEWIIADIYKNNRDPNVTQSLLSSSKIDCAIFKNLLDRKTPGGFEAASQSLNGHESRILENDFYSKNIVRCR